MVFSFRRYDASPFQVSEVSCYVTTDSLLFPKDELLLGGLCAKGNSVGS